MKNIIYHILSTAILILPIKTIHTIAQVCPTPEVFLGNDTLLCPGTSLYLDAGLHYTVKWQDGSIDRYFLVSEPGIYSVTVSNECGSTASDEIIIEPAEKPEIEFVMPEREYFCRGEIVDVTGEVVNASGSILYEWIDRNSSDATLNIDTSGIYELKVTNEIGCESTREVKMDFQYPYEKEKLLLATFDPTIEKNIIIWSRTPDKRTQSYILFNGNTEDNFLAETSYDRQNLYIDENTDPYTRSAYYNISVKDSCGNRSEFYNERSHRTMHLRASTDGNGFAQLAWENYLGFDYDKFYVYRGTSPDNMEILDSLFHDPGKDQVLFTDEKAEEDILYYYQVKVKTPEIIYLDNPDGRKAGSGPFVHSLSNLEDNLIKSTGADELYLLDQYLRVFPNPVEDNMKVTFATEHDREMNISLYNISGRKIISISEGILAGGEHEFTLNLQQHGLEPGIYILKIEAGQLGTLARKVIKSRQ